MRVPDCPGRGWSTPEIHQEAERGRAWARGGSGLNESVCVRFLGGAWRWRPDARQNAGGSRPCESLQFADAGGALGLSFYQGLSQFA